MRKHKNNIPPEVERHLEFCQRVHERMQQDGSWPWKDNHDSTLSENLVESGETSETI